jgi:hypothetical protein
LRPKKINKKSFRADATVAYFRSVSSKHAIYIIELVFRLFKVRAMSFPRMDSW